MSESELRAATDISSSINKQMSLDENFGIGAKVSGLTASPDGIRYRSCRDGEVHEVTIGWDEEQQTYVRFAVHMADGSSQTIYDVTAAARREGKPLDRDWTEVVLLGQAPDHDTVAEPIGKGVEVDRSFIATSIYRRFVRFAPGVQVKIDVAMTRGGGKGETGRNRTLQSLEDILPKLGASETVSDTATGISIRYINDPKAENSAHSMSSRANPAAGSTTFCALIYKSERYDFKTQKVWSSVAPIYGIPFGSKVLTIEISVPEAVVMPNQYRDALLWKHDRSPITTEYYASMVRALMPEWVREIIRSESPDNVDDLNDLQSDLQRILDEARLPTNVLKQSKVGLRTDPASSGTPENEPIRLESEEDPGPSPEPRPTPNGRAASTRVRLAPEGASISRAARSLERAPEIKILDDPEEIIAKGIKGKAAKFYKETQQLFVNGMYPVVDKMANELTNDLSTVDDPEFARASCKQAAQRTLAFRVGKATCFALAKKLVDEWSTEDLNRATSPESLSLAADDYRQSIAPAKRWLRDKHKADAVAAFEVA